MKINIYLPIITFIAGTLFFIINHHPIIHYLINKNITLNLKNKNILKKNAKILYWRHEKWHKEEVELIWSEDTAQNIKYLINNWLGILDEEKIMQKKVSLQDAALTASSQEAILSFDRNPFNKQDSTFEKILWIEGLLKTLRDNDIKILNVRFLVHHQPLNDYKLDFSKPWPISGFLSN